MQLYEENENQAKSSFVNYNFNHSNFYRNNRIARKDLVFRQELDAHVVDSFMQNLRIYMQECGESNPSIYKYEEFEEDNIVIGSSILHTDEGQRSGRTCLAMNTMISLDPPEIGYETERILLQQKRINKSQRRGALICYTKEPVSGYGKRKLDRFFAGLRFLKIDRLPAFICDLFNTMREENFEEFKKILGYDKENFKSFRVEEITSESSEKTLNECAEVFIKGNNFPIGQKKLNIDYYSRLLKSMISRGPRVRSFYLRDLKTDNIVSFAQIVHGGGVVGIHNCVTSLPTRRKGYATHLILQIMKVVKEEGYRYIVFQGSRTGTPILRKIGAVHLFNIYVYVDPEPILTCWEKLCVEFLCLTRFNDLLCWGSSLAQIRNTVLCSAVILFVAMLFVITALIYIFYWKK